MNRAADVRQSGWWAAWLWFASVSFDRLFLGTSRRCGAGVVLQPQARGAGSYRWQAADIDAGFERLQRRGPMTDDERLTDAGPAFLEWWTTHGSGARPGPCLLNVRHHDEQFAVVVPADHPDSMPNRCRSFTDCDQ